MPIPDPRWIRKSDAWLLLQFHLNSNLFQQSGIGPRSELLCQHGRMLLAILGLVPIVNQQAEVKRVPSITGNVTVVKGFTSKVLSNQRNISIYLPPQYKSSPDRRYPVLYCHDGQNIFDGATSFIPGKEWRIDETAEALINAGLIEPIIVVGIDNAGIDRAAEYLPTRFKWNNNELGGKADLYGKFLLEELKPYIDKTYRTKPDAKNTGLMGSSLGGIITFYLGITHPDRFSKLGVVSPSVWVNEREMIKRTDGLSRKLPIRVWIDMGTQEAPSATKDAKDLALALEKKGWKPGKDLIYYEDGFAQHNEDAWARRVPAILMWMFGKK